GAGAAAERCALESPLFAAIRARNAALDENSVSVRRYRSHHAVRCIQDRVANLSGEKTRNVGGDYRVREAAVVDSHRSTVCGDGDVRKPAAVDRVLMRGKLS